MKVRKAIDLKRTVEGLALCLKRAPDDAIKQRLSDIIRTLCWILGEQFGDPKQNGVYQILDEGLDLGKSLENAREQAKWTK